MTTIVYIEDEAGIRQDVSEELREANYNVIEADNGIDGLAAIRGHRPDLVLCDISMPGMSGLELLSEVRKGDPLYRDLPFIFLTALADRSDIINGKKIGADDYLTKPIDLELLLVTIDTRLRQIKSFEEKKNRQLVKLYLTLTGDDAMPDVNVPQGIMAGNEEETSGSGLAITIIADDLFDSQEVVSMFEAQGHDVVSMNSGRKFLDILETGVLPDLVLMTLHTVDLAAPLLIKLLKDTYRAQFPVLLLIPHDMTKMVDEEQRGLFDGHIVFPCTAAEFSAEILKLLPQGD